MPVHPTLAALLAKWKLRIHIWGALERTQPWTEDAEILMYDAATGAAAWIRFSVLA